MSGRGQRQARDRIAAWRRDRNMVAIGNHEHVSLCASRVGCQRPRQLRFRSDGHHLVYRTLQRRPGERAAFLRCAATVSSARALSRYFLEGTTTYTPHVCDQHFDLRRPRSSPLPGARLRIIRA